MAGRLWPTLLTWVLRPLYRLYEERLAGQIAGQPVPRHIGIILDGNRRHGERNGVRDPQAIYTLGAHKLDDVLDWCADLGVPAVTLWVFSTDNLDRPIEQISGILAAIEAKVRSFAHHPIIHERRVRVGAIGKLESLPPSLREALRVASEATATYAGMTLTIAIAYGGRDEIVDAVRSLLAEQIERGVGLPDAVEQISRQAIARHLYTAGMPDPDLIIRTSGEIRLSGFLLWQSAYTSSISVTCPGQLSEDPTCAPCGPISNGNDGLVANSRHRPLRECLLEALGLLLCRKPNLILSPARWRHGRAKSPSSPRSCIL